MKKKMAEFILEEDVFIRKKKEEQLNPKNILKSR